MKIIELEEQRNRILEILLGPYSERARFRVLVSFFDWAETHFSFSSLQSYYLEFSSSFFQLANESSLRYSDPVWLERVFRLFELFSKQFTDAVSAREMTECQKTIKSALIEIYFVLGEWETGFSTLEQITGEALNETIRGSLKNVLMNHTDAGNSVKTAWSVLREACPVSCQICFKMLTSWNQQFRQPRTDRVNVLFVESIPPQTNNESEYGILLPIRIKTALRPRHKEEDAVRFVQNWPEHAGHLSNRVREILKIIRPILRARYSEHSTERSYLLHYSLPERQMEIGGHSHEAVLALLAAGSMINAYYGSSVFKYHSDTVISAGVDVDGGLKSIDGVKAKVQAAFFSPLRRLIVPRQNLRDAINVLEELRVKYPEKHLVLESAEHLNDVLDDRNLSIHRKITAPRRLTAALIRNKEKAVFSLVSLIFILVVGFLADYYLMKDRTPTNYEVQGQTLVVTNAAGDFLWKHDFKLPLTTRYYSGAQQHRVIRNDVDSDGKDELLFGTYENTSPEFSGLFYCFKPNGHIIFQQKIGQEMTFGEEKYENHYRTAFVDAQDLDGDGKKEFLSIGYQYPYFPCVINRWSLDGEKIGEYWHAGQLTMLDYIDIDSCGRPEIFATGVNNEYNCAVLAVFKPDGLKGTSPQTSDSHYAISNFPQGGELYYVRFPQSGIYDVLHTRDVGVDVRLIDQGIQVTVSNGMRKPAQEVSTNLYYLFRPDMTLSELSVCDSYRYTLVELIGREPSAREIEKLKKVHYFNGKGWVDQAVMVGR